MGPNLETLPEGFSFAEEDEAVDYSGLPKGFTFEEEQNPYETPYDVDEERIGKFSEMSAWEKYQLAQDMKTEREYRTSRGTTKGLASGATLGLSENIPDMKEEYGDIGFGSGKFIGEFAPVTGLMKIFKLPAYAREGASVSKKALNALSNVLKAGGVGASKKALEDVFQGKVPDYGDVIEHGASWAAIDAILQGGGATARAIKGALEKNIKSGENAYEVLNKMSKELQEKGVDLEKIDEVSEEAFQILNREGRAAEERAANPDVRGRNLRDRKVKKEYWEEIEEKVPGETEAPEVKLEPNELPREAVTEESLDTVATRAEDKMELGENVKKDVNRRVKASKDEYKPRYELASEAAIGEHPDTNKVVRNIWDNFDRIKGDFRSVPEDYQKTLGVLENLMKDMGAQFEKNEAGEVVGLMFSEKIPLDKLMELGRRSGRMAKYGNVNPAIRDAVKAANQDIKQLIRDTLKDNPEAYKMWTEAEKIFQEKARIFDNPTVMKIRKEGFKPEDIGTMIKKPSDLQKVKEAVSPEQFAQIEREILAEMNDASYDKASKMFRELKRNMSEDSRKLADEILLSKKPAAKMSQGDKNKELERWVTNKVSQPVPSTALNKLWDSKLGNQRIRRSLQGNPNKEQIIEHLQNQKIQNASKRWIKESGQLDYGNLKEWLSKSQNRQAIREVAGQDGLKFMDELSRFSDKAKQKQKVYDLLQDKPLANFKPPKRGDEIIQNLKKKITDTKYPLETKVKELWNSLSDETKTFIKLAGMFKFGVYKTLLGVKTAPMILEVAKSPRLRNAFRKAMDTKSTNPYVIYGLWKAIEPEEKEED